jgi:hypothetical protein
MDLMQIAQQFGPWGLILCGMYLMLRQQQRFIETTLVELIKNNTEAMNGLKVNVAAMEAILERMQDRQPRGSA